MNESIEKIITAFLEKYGLIAANLSHCEEYWWGDEFCPGCELEKTTTDVTNFLRDALLRIQKGTREEDIATVKSVRDLTIDGQGRLMKAGVLLALQLQAQEDFVETKSLEQ